MWIAQEPSPYVDDVLTFKVFLPAPISADIIGADTYKTNSSISRLKRLLRIGDRFVVDAVPIRRQFA